MLPTVAEVLALDPVRSGAPRVLAGAERLSTPVRWVHVIELAQAAHLLRGGELVLSTGIALPDDAAGLSRYVAELASVGVSGLAVELGSRYSRSLPAALVSAAGNHQLPLIAFERETQFIAITEAVHARIIDAQLAELRSAERLHQVFTELAVSGAAAEEVVTQTATLAGCPVILENLAHQVVACAPLGQDAASLLAGFAARSRAVRVSGRTGHDATAGWLVTVVGARGQDWGRLIMLRGGAPAPGDEALIERAATTLALGRLLDHQRESLERHAHRTILSAFLGNGYSDHAEAEARALALGVPVTGRLLVAVVVRLGQAKTAAGHESADPGATVPGVGGVATPGHALAGPARAAGIADAIAGACRHLRLPALVASLDDDRVAALLALPPRSDPDTALRRLADQLRPRLADADVIGAGSAVDSVSGVQRSLLEADHVAEAAAAAGGRQPYYQIPDLRLRGLLHLLRDDPRLQAFAERELGQLLVHDDATGSELVPALAAYLESGGNKAAAAKRAGLARPTMYERLRQIEDVLGVELEPAESRLSLHVALLALRASAS
ncbi:MAG TPA: PucR family transcriptional regulator ligand-binding domain-containing protein [Streptosporangiaceae bacterium]|nr:PucR family transcriptional regulator ligand-binding domain-containing protein [Streptosporangiaceae bacterium]